MEKWNVWLISTVPPDIVAFFSDPQKIIGTFLVISIIQIGIILFLWALYRRDINVPNQEKEDIELSKKLGEEFHDILVNWANEGKLTRRQYKWASRILKIAFPGGIYGYKSLSAKTRELFRVQMVKDSIQKRMQTQAHKLTVGLKSWQEIVAALEKPQQDNGKFGRKKAS